MRCQLASLLATLVVFSLMLLSSAHRLVIFAKSNDNKLLGRTVIGLASEARSSGCTTEGPLPFAPSNNGKFIVYKQKLVYILPCLIALLKLGPNISFSISDSKDLSGFIKKGM